MPDPTATITTTSGTASIAGTLFYDANRDGRIEAGDQGLPSFTIALEDATNQIVATTNTDGDGNYIFSGLATGTYTVTFPAFTGEFTSTLPNPAIVTVASGQAVANVDDGVAFAPSVSGSVFSDVNRNGLKDAGEAGVAGADVMLVADAGTALATVVATTVTDSGGHYEFDGFASGDYSVVAGALEGETGTTPTAVQVGVGLSSDAATADFGVAPEAVPVVAVPKTTSVNILLRGQSNAGYFTTEGYLAELKQRVEQELGFDGVNQTINLIADINNPDGVNTLNPGTGMIHDWLKPVSGSYRNGWTAQPLELGLLTDIERQPAAVKAAPTLVVWLHNESDSDTDGVTAPEWESAAQYEAGLVRAALGNDASMVPYLFVNAIPFPLASIYPDQVAPTQASQDLAEQAIKIGMSDLAADPQFNGSIAAQESDVTMDHDGYVGGAHLGPADQQQLVNRLAASIANGLSASALPGSPEALAGGHQDSLGPQVVAATLTGNPDQVLLTVRQDDAAGFDALGSAAADGVGWSIRNDASGADSMIEATGTAAEIVDATHLLVTFNQAVPTGGRLLYAWGAGRIVADPTQPGNGDAVYDSDGFPIWTDPAGVVVDAPLPPAAPATGSSASPSVALPTASPAVPSVPAVAPTAVSAPANNAVTLLPQPVVAFAPTITMHGSTATLTGTASAASGATVERVTIADASATLGSARLNSDGTWSFTFDGGAGAHPGIEAVVTDSQGSTATTSSGFDLTTGLTGEPYATILDRYDPSSAAYLGSTFYKPGGALYEESRAAALPDGGSALTYSDGAFFKAKDYAAFTDRFDADGTLTQHVEDKTDGSHLIEIDADRQVAQSLGTDTFVDSAADTHFVFHHGAGAESVYGFQAAGPGHDLLSLPNSDAGRLAQILADARPDGHGDTVLHLGHGDSIILFGVGTAELMAHPGDVGIHA